MKLIFIELPNPDFAIQRVNMRVKQGGHFIAGDVVRRRFYAGLKNFNDVYKPIVDVWLHFSGEEQITLVDWSER